jgi:hypothetical protein
MMFAAGALVVMLFVLSRIVRLCTAVISGFSLFFMLIFGFIWLVSGRETQWQGFVHSSLAFIIFFAITTFLTVLPGLSGRRAGIVLSQPPL